MDRDSLERSWRITRGHLASARAELPLGDARITAALGEGDEELEHNELELAMEAYAFAAEVASCRGAVWLHLARAAENMGLEERAADFRAVDSSA